MKILLVDRNVAMVREWKSAFEDRDDVEVFADDYFAHPADAMVSPDNSFGIMDGGLDAAIRDVLGHTAEKRAQRAIIDNHHGELPVGSAIVVDTDERRWPRMIVAPTMRIPENVAKTLNAYLAFRAALLACIRVDIKSVVCCGLATGIGGMDYRRAAIQMRMALLQAMGPSRMPSFSHIHAAHEAMRTA